MLAAVGPTQALKNTLKREGDSLRLGAEVIGLAGLDRVIAVGADKAGAPMAQALEEVLGDKLVAERVVVTDGYAVPTRVVEIMEASHPVPDQHGVAAPGPGWPSCSPAPTSAPWSSACFSDGGSALHWLPPRRA